MRPPSTDVTPAAERCLHAVHRRPGAGVGTVARDAGVDESTAAYHLRRLAKRGLVVSVRAGRVLAHYASGSGHCPVLRQAVPVLGQRDPPRALARWLAGLAPGRAVRVPDAVREAGVTEHEARWALAEAERLGIVTRAAGGWFTLTPGSERCAAHAASGDACPLWGACAPGGRWRSRSDT